MSIIVAAKRNGQIAIAADTAQSHDSLLLSSTHVTNHRKLFRCGNSYVGLAGWSASQEIFESLVRNHPDEINFDNREEIFETSRRLHKIMKDEYFLATDEDKEQPVESSQYGMLIANMHGIYELESYRSVAEFELYYALGSGKKLALGAMHASYEQGGSAADVVTAGVRAACEFDDGCLLPMQLINIEPETSLAG